MLPKLTGAKLGIKELLNQRGLGLLLSNVAGSASTESISKNMGRHGLQRKALDALSPPFRADLVARDAPNLLCVGLEKSAIKVLSKSVDEEVFEGTLLPMRH